MNDQFPSPVIHTTVEATPIGQPDVEDEIKPTLLLSESRNKAPYFPFQEHAADKPGSLKLLENGAKQEITSVLTSIVINDSNKPGYVSMETKHSVEISELDIVPTLLSRNQEEIVMGVLKQWTADGSQKKTNIFQNVVSEVIDSQKQLNFSKTSENDATPCVSRVEHRKDDETMIPHTENPKSGQLTTAEISFLNIANNVADMDDLILFNTSTPAAAQFYLPVGQTEYTEDDLISFNTSTPAVAHFKLPVDQTEYSEDDLISFNTSTPAAAHFKLPVDQTEYTEDDLISFNTTTPAAQFQLPVGQTKYTQDDPIFASAPYLNQNEDVLDTNKTSVYSNTSITVSASMNHNSLTGSTVYGKVGKISDTEQFGVMANKVDVESQLVFTNAEGSSTRPQQVQQNELQEIINPSSIVPVSSQLNSVLTTDEICEQSPRFQEGTDVEQVSTLPKQGTNSAATGALTTSEHSVHKAQEVDQVVMRSKAKARTDPPQTAHHPKQSSVNKKRPESMMEMSPPPTGSNRLSDMRKSFTIESKSLPPLRKLSALRPLSASTSDLSRLGGEQIGRPASGSFAISTFSTRITKIDYPKTRQNDGSPFQVDVLKGIVGIGIKVKATSKGHVQITEIQSGGPVEKNGHVRVGDYLLFVSSTDMSGQTDARVQQVLRLLPRGLTKLVISIAAPASRTEPRPSFHDRNSANVQHLQRLPQESHTTSHSSVCHTTISVSASESGISEVKDVPPVKPIATSIHTFEPSTADATEAKDTGLIETTQGSQTQSVGIQPASQSAHIVERPKPAPRHNNAIKKNYEKPLVEKTSSTILQVFDDPIAVETETNFQKQGSENSTDIVVPHATERSSTLAQLTTDRSLAAEFIPDNNQVSLQAELIPLITQSNTSAQSLDKHESDTVSSGTKETTIKDVKEVDKVSSGISVRKDTTVSDVKEVDRVSSGLSERKDTTVRDVKEIDKVSSEIIETKEITIKDDKEADKVSSQISERKDTTVREVKEVKMFPRITKTKESTIRTEKLDNGISPHQTVPLHTASTHQPSPSNKLEGSEPSHVKPQRKVSAGYERLKSMTGTTKSSAIIEKSGTFVSSTAKLFDQKAAGSDELASEQLSATRRRSSQSGIANSDMIKIINTPLKSIKERWKSTENIASSSLSFKQPEPSYLRTRSTSYSTLKTTNGTTLELARKISESVLNSTQINSALSPRKTSFDSISGSTPVLQTTFSALNEYQSPGKFLGSKKETVEKSDFSKTGKLNLNKTGQSDIYKSTSVSVLRKNPQENYSSAVHGKVPHAAAQVQYRKSYPSSVQSSIHSRSSGINEEVVDNTIRKLDVLLLDPPYQRTDTHPHDLLLCFPEVRSSISTDQNASRENGKNSNSRDPETVNITTKLQEFVITLPLQGKPKSPPENSIPGHKTDKSVITKVEIASLKRYSEGVNVSSEMSSVKEQHFEVKELQKNIVREQGSQAMESAVMKIKNCDGIIQRDEQSIYSVELSSSVSPESEPPSLPSAPPPPLALRDSNLLVNVHDLENLNASPFVSESATEYAGQKLDHNSLNMSSTFHAIQLDIDTHAGKLLVADTTIVAKGTQTSTVDSVDSLSTTGGIFHERDDIRVISPSPVDMLSEDSGMPADEDQEVATDDAISPPGELAESAYLEDSVKNVLMHSDIEAGILAVETNTRQFQTRTTTQNNTIAQLSETSVAHHLLHRDETYSVNGGDITESEDLPPPLLPSSLPPSVASVNSSTSFTEDLISDHTSPTVQTFELQSFFLDNNLLQSDSSFAEKQEIAREVLVNKTPSKVRSKLPETSGINIDTVYERLDLSHITQNSSTVVSNVASETRSEIALNPAINQATGTENVNLSLNTINLNTALSRVASETRPDITNSADSVREGADSPQTKKPDSITGLSVSTTTQETRPEVLNRSTKRIETVTQSADLSHIKKGDLIRGPHVSRIAPDAHSEIRGKHETKNITESVSDDLVHVPGLAVQGPDVSQSLDTSSATVTSKRKWCLRSNICLSPVLVGDCGVPQRPSYAERLLAKALSYSDLIDVIGKANAVLDVSSAPDSLLLLIVHLHGDGAPLGVELKHQGGTVFRVSGIKKGSPVWEEGGAAVGDWLVAVDSLWCDHVTVMRFLSRLAKPKHDSVLVFARENKAVNIAEYPVQETILMHTQDRPTAKKRHTSKVSEQEHSLFTEIPNKAFVSEAKPSEVISNVQDQSEKLALKVSPLLEQVPELQNETPPLPMQPPPHQVPQLMDQTQPCTKPDSQLMEQAQILLDQPSMVKGITPCSDKTSSLEQEISPMLLKQPSALVQEKLTKSLQTEKVESILTSSDTMQVKTHPAKATKVLSQEHTGSEKRRTSVNKTTLPPPSLNSSEVPIQGSSIAVAKLQEELPAKDLSSAGSSAELGSGVHKVIITKGATGVGFCLEGGVGSPKGDLPITIKRIFKGGPAEKGGVLKVKDEILEVNGLKFSKMGHYEAWNHLKFLDDGEVHFTIRRP